MGKKTKSLRHDLQILVQRLLTLVDDTEHVDWKACHAARWQRGRIAGGLVPHHDVDDITLEDLLCVDEQKRQIALNTEQFVNGFPANNVLLWGARGTGKSSLIHALLNGYAGQNLRLIEVAKHRLVDLPDIAVQIKDEPYWFVLFCDDLSFEADDPSYKALKSAMEGSVLKNAPNLLIYATSNRRHLLPEYHSDNEQTRVVANELHEGEVVEEKISLSDRFGLWLSFYPFKQDAYLAVVQHWLTRLANDHETRVIWDDNVRGAALRWALARGVRSGRTAQHFARHWVGQKLLSNRAAV